MTVECLMLEIFHTYIIYLFPCDDLCKIFVTVKL